MKPNLTLLQKIGRERPKPADEEEPLGPFERRLKMVNRARVVNQVNLGGPVFRSRPSETEA